MRWRIGKFSFLLSLINCSTGIIASNPIAFWSVACAQKESCQELTRNSRLKTYEKIAEFSLGAQLCLTNLFSQQLLNGNSSIFYCATKVKYPRRQYFIWLLYFLIWLITICSNIQEHTCYHFEKERTISNIFCHRSQVIQTRNNWNSTSIRNKTVCWFQTSNTTIACRYSNRSTLITTFK